MQRADEMNAARGRYDYCDCCGALANDLDRVTEDELIALWRHFGASPEDTATFLRIGSRVCGDCCAEAGIDDVREAV